MKYLCDPHIVPTVVPGSLADLQRYAQRCVEFTDALHVDIADGTFARNTTWPLVRLEQMQELESFRTTAEIPLSLKLEAHLMVREPESVAAALARAGFSITAHIESFTDAHEASEAIQRWKTQGAAAVGLAVLLDTPLESLDTAIDACDYVHVLSVQHIGEQGQPFDDRALQRVEELHARYPDLLVAVDGGVTEATVEQLARAGANRMSVGAAISQSAHPAATYAKIHERAMLGCAPLVHESLIQ